MPSEIGILIADRLDTASQASMVLVNRTTASWVSKSLLARVNACQLTDDAEVLERDDSPETVARFVSAVASVCIPKDERTKFVAGIVKNMIPFLAEVDAKPPRTTAAFTPAAMARD